MKPRGTLPLRVQGLTIKAAGRVVKAWHRHNVVPRGGMFATSVVGPLGAVHGVAIVGRPVAQELQKRGAVEIVRVATDGTPNACSMLYGACRAAARVLGWASVYTYTRVDEPGTSLRAAGFVLDAVIKGRDWNNGKRRGKRRAQEIIDKQRWVVHFGGDHALS